MAITKKERERGLFDHSEIYAKTNRFPDAPQASTADFTVDPDPEPTPQPEDPTEPSTEESKSEETGYPDAPKWEPLDHSKIKERIEKQKGLVEEDQKFFKDTYQKILDQRSKDMNKLQFKKLLGMFMDSMANYAAARAGVKTGAVSPDWDWKGQQQEIDKNLSLQIDKLKSSHSQRRQATRESFDNDMRLLDLARREGEAARQWKIRAALEERRAKIATNKERKKKHESAAKEADMFSKQAKRNAKTNVKEYQKMVKQKLKDLGSAMKELKKSDEWADEEEAIVTMLTNYRDAGVINDADEKAIMKKVGKFVTSGELEETLKELESKRKNMPNIRKQRFSQIKDNWQTVFAEELKQNPKFVPSSYEIWDKVEEWEAWE